MDHYLPRLLLVTFCIGLLTSCATHDLPDARSAFYQGNYVLAEEKIGNGEVDGKDSVLVLMERGTIYQAKGEYEKSSKDFIQANNILGLLETYSVSEGAESWVINDKVYSYKGAPFERTMLHSMTALNHLSLGNWGDGGVEARRIIHSLRPDERGEDYPDIAFSRYLAAFILDMTNDRANAEAQYKLVDELLPDLNIDKQGRFGQNTKQTPEKRAGDRELVCFLLLGRSPSVPEVRRNNNHFLSPPRIRIYAGKRHLGNAVILTSIRDLVLSTWKLQAPARTAKMVARIAAKETVARQIDSQNEALGALTRIILIGLLERPDFRHWETLPQWLAVARLPFPAELSSFEVRLEGEGASSGSTISVQQPLVKLENIIFSFARDL